MDSLIERIAERNDFHGPECKRNVLTALELVEIGLKGPLNLDTIRRVFAECRQKLQDLYDSLEGGEQIKVLEVRSYLDVELAAWESEAESGFLEMNQNV